MKPKRTIVCPDFVKREVHSDIVGPCKHHLGGFTCSLPGHIMCESSGREEREATEED